MSSSERPVVGIINASEEVRDLLTEVFEDEGFAVVATLAPDIKRGNPTIEEFIQSHRPVAIVYDIAIPYEENWRLFQRIQQSEAGRRTQWVLTTINKRALDELVGPTQTFELVGKP